MRRVVLIIGVALAVLVAGAAVAAIIASRVMQTPPAASGPTSTGAAADGAEAVSADDYCYVEAMIFYRVSESRLATLMLSKEDIGAGMRAFAQEKAAQADAELEDLRAWYVSWRDQRPAVPPVDGPCAGHGAEHVQMPGIPSRASQDRLVDAQGATAEHEFATILHEQNAGMVALIAGVRESGPNSRVLASATAAEERAAADDEELRRLAGG